MGRLIAILQFFEWEMRFLLAGFIVLFGSGLCWVAEGLVRVGAWIIDEEY